jgi:hypothetical protein
LLLHVLMERAELGMIGQHRDPVTIITDWIVGFTGDDRPPYADDWRLNAEQLVGWLKDEGWEFHRAYIQGNGNVVIEGNTFDPTGKPYTPESNA